MKRILVVDDEARLVNLVATNLELEGYEVAAACNGEDALAAIHSFDPDLIVLDVMMPGTDGLEVLKLLRRTSDTPVILVTAKTRINDRIHGLDAGADDYLIKPFSIGELLARIRSVFRRHPDKSLRPSGPVSVLLSYGDILSVDAASHTCLLDGKPIPLQKLEFKLLVLLMNGKNRVLTHEYLIENAWDNDGGDLTTLRVAIAKLRAKLKENSKGIDFISTVHGLGYRFGTDSAE
jgi:DNA-binding response OmpR family regulator